MNILQRDTTIKDSIAANASDVHGITRPSRSLWPIFQALNMRLPWWMQINTWLSAQDATSVQYLQPFVLSHDADPNGQIPFVRFSHVESLGNMQSVHSIPNDDPLVSTSAFLTSTVLWECGGDPELAKELHSVLSTDSLLMTDTNFDHQVTSRLDSFAERAIRFRHLGEAIGELAVSQDFQNIDYWHQGLTYWLGTRFEISPLTARVLRRFATRSKQISCKKKDYKWGDCKVVVGLGLFN